MLPDDIAPYVKDGQMYLPERAIELLIEAGFQRDIVEAARHGLALDDEKEGLAEIRKTLEKILQQLTRQT